MFPLGAVIGDGPDLAAIITLEVSLQVERYVTPTSCRGEIGRKVGSCRRSHTPERMPSPLPRREVCWTRGPQQAVVNRTWDLPTGCKGQVIIERDPECSMSLGFARHHVYEQAVEAARTECPLPGTVTHQHGSATPVPVNAQAADRATEAV